MHFYDITGSACCTNNKQIAGSVSFSVLPIVQQKSC